MPVFKYEAIDKNGATSRGTLIADSIRNARCQIKEKDLLPTLVKEASNGAQASTFLFGPTPAIKRTELTVWTRQFASLVSSGLSIERSLQSLIDESDNQKMTELLSGVTAQVKAGATLSAAFGSYPKEFDSIYCSVVAAGEASGSLPTVLTRMADDLEATQALKSKVIGAALYPAIVCGMAVLIVTFLMVYVLPQVATAFSGSKQALPLLTEIMLKASALFKSYWMLLALLACSAVSAFKVMMRSASIRERFDEMLLSLPVLGKLIGHYNAARFANTFGMLTEARIPILEALTAAGKTVSNTAMRRDILEVTKLVKEGAPLGVALKTKGTFPKLVSTFAKLGGETGNLGSMMTKVGAQLSTEVQRRSVSLASVLEPFLILAMGLVVMMIVLAVLLPIIQMNSFVK